MIVPRSIGAVMALLGLGACRVAPDSAAAPPLANLVVYGRVWTGDSAKPWAQAVAVAGDTIAAVGDSGAVARLQGPDTRVINNGKAMVVPGFIDSHTHFMEGGFQLAQVDLRDAKSPAEFIARIRDYSRRLKPGEWILGGDWDHERWAGTPLPRREWIDTVTPHNPVWIERLDGHMALANTPALRAARVTQQTPEVPGGTIVRDASGRPTGILKDAAQDLVAGAVTPASPAQIDSALARATAWAAARGVTSVLALWSSSVPITEWAEYAAHRRARRAGAMKTRVAFYLPLREWRRLADTVRVHGRGDHWLRTGGVKGFVDGSLGSTTALFYRPYEDSPETSGLLVTPEDSLRASIGGADSAGLHVIVHAIGERANGLLLEIFDSVGRAHGNRDRRFRVEHAQHLRRADIGRLARSGVVASMQPYHAIDDGRWAEKRIGPERIKTTYAFRSLLDNGAHLAFGSDWTVAPIDPLLGIYAAVTRRTLDEKHPGGWVPGEKITVEEALMAYTGGAAYGLFAEGARGKLTPGYLADLVVLDQDLTAIAPEAIEKVGVRATVVGGKVVFSKPEAGNSTFGLR